MRYPCDSYRFVYYVYPLCTCCTSLSPRGPERRMCMQEKKLITERHNERIQDSGNEKEGVKEKREMKEGKILWNNEKEEEEKNEYFFFFFWMHILLLYLSSWGVKAAYTLRYRRTVNITRSRTPCSQKTHREYIWTGQLISFISTSEDAHSRGW